MAVCENGRYRILGRRDVDIFKVGGQTVSALETENVLREHPAVKEAAVVGLEDRKWGHQVAAAVVPMPGQKVTLRILRRWSKERLAVYKAPIRLLLLDALPRNEAQPHDDRQEQQRHEQERVEQPRADHVTVGETQGCARSATRRTRRAGEPFKVAKRYRPAARLPDPDQIRDKPAPDHKHHERSQLQPRTAGRLDESNVHEQPTLGSKALVAPRQAECGEALQ